MLARPAVAGAFHRLAPPLKTNFAHHRLAHRFANAGDLIVEGVEREEMWPEGRRREQGREVAVGIVPPHRGFAGSREPTAGHALSLKKLPCASRAIVARRGCGDRIANDMRGLQQSEPLLFWLLQATICSILYSLAKAEIML